MRIFMERVNLRRKSANNPPLPAGKDALQGLFLKCLGEIVNSLKINNFPPAWAGSQWTYDTDMMCSKPSVTLGVYRYGSWAFDMDDEMGMSEPSFDLVVDKVMAVHKSYPNLGLKIETDERKWLYITVK